MGFNSGFKGLSDVNSQHFFWTFYYRKTSELLNYSFLFGYYLGFEKLRTVTHDFQSQILGFLEPTQEQYRITHVYILLQHVSTCFDPHQVTYLSNNDSDDNQHRSKHFVIIYKCTQ